MFYIFIQHDEYERWICLWKRVWLDGDQIDLLDWQIETKTMNRQMNTLIDQ